MFLLPPPRHELVHSHINWLIADFGQNKYRSSAGLVSWAGLGCAGRSWGDLELELGREQERELVQQLGGSGSGVGLELAMRVRLQVEVGWGMAVVMRGEDQWLGVNGSRKPGGSGGAEVELEAGMGVSLGGGRELVEEGQRVGVMSCPAGGKGEEVWEAMSGPPSSLAHSL